MSDIAKMIAIAKRFGGGGSGPSEVVILPEMETTVEEGQAYIMTPLSATPTDGATAKVTYNGTEYPCTVAYAGEDGIDAYAMGNFDAVGMPFTGGNPDAPFVVALTPAGEGDVYGVVMPTDGATAITLSIVQTEGAASGGDAGGGVFTVRTTGSYENNAFTFDGFDKSFSEMKAAYDADKYIRVVVETSGGLHYIGQVVMAVSGDAAASFGGFALCVEIMNNPKYFNYFYFYAGDNGAIATLQAV